MSLSAQEKFEKAVAYVQALPKDGPYQPDQDTKLKVRPCFPRDHTIGSSNRVSTTDTTSKVCISEQPR